MASLFNIGEEFNTLYDLANELEYDENNQIIDNSESLTEIFNDIQGEMVDKFDATNYIIKELKADATTISDEIKRLQQKKKAIENKADRLRSLISATLEISGETKIKGKFSFSIREKIELNYDDVNVDFIDDEFVRVKKELNKSKISEFIKAGGTIENLKQNEIKVLTIR